jgi:hypothetical protein
LLVNAAVLSVTKKDYDATVLAAILATVATRQVASDVSSLQQNQSRQRRDAGQEA